MSEKDPAERPPSPYDQMMDLTVADLTQFLEKNGAKSACPSCGRNDWEMFDPAKAGMVQWPLQRKGRGIVLGGPVVFVITMMCNNCGYFRLHSAGKILQWKQGQTKSAV
jgi:hypothetical protein